ncbi:MAG: replication initiation protein [Colwellia sp.]
MYSFKNNASKVKATMHEQQNKLPQHIKKGHQLLFSRQDLSAREQDVLALVMSSMKPEHWENKTPKYSFPCADLSDYLNIDNKHIASTLAPIAERLSERKVGVKDLINEEFEYTPLFKKISYKNGELTVSPNDELKSEYIEYKQGFALINTANFIAIKREYSKRLYEILCRFKEKGTLKTFAINELKGLFGILDEQDKLKKDKSSFKNNSVFMKRCIRESITEIMNNTQTKKELLFFSSKEKIQGYETTKKGNKIIAIKFLYRWINTANPESRLNEIGAIDIIRELEIKALGGKSVLTIDDLEMLASAYTMINKTEKSKEILAVIHLRKLKEDNDGTTFKNEIDHIDSVLDKLEIMKATQGGVEY